jgi:hypothetical protein
MRIFRKREIKCERLVQYTGQEIVVNGASAGLSNFKVETGRLSNRIKVINQVPDIMKALDNNQYLLCQQISQLAEDNPLRDQLIRIRVLNIQQLTHLEALICSPRSDTEMNIEIIKWIQEMGDLNKKTNEILLNPMGPSRTTFSELPKQIPSPFMNNIDHGSDIAKTSSTTRDRVDRGFSVEHYRAGFGEGEISPMTSGGVSFVSPSSGDVGLQASSSGGVGFQASSSSRNHPRS